MCEREGTPKSNPAVLRRADAGMGLAKYRSMAKLNDIEADPCASPVFAGGVFIKCGSTVREYTVGGRQTSSRCLGPCKGIAREDATICHAKCRWSVEAIRNWWRVVRGAA